MRDHDLHRVLRSFIVALLPLAVEAQPVENISGTWDDPGPGMSQAKVTYSQSAGRITAQGSFVTDGYQCVWSGTGRIQGNRVEHSVTYSKRPPGDAWSKADGRLVLTLSSDGATLIGQWYNNAGGSGVKKLIRSGLSVSGVWRDTGPGMSNAQVTYSQSGNRITASGSFVTDGFTCVWSGAGTIEGARLEHSVNYSQRPPGAAWSKADGKLVLTLSADGNTLSGTWYNNNGNSGPKQLIRSRLSVSGVWRDTGPGISNAQVTYSQSGNRITASGSFLTDGFTCVWSGAGTIEGARLEHSVNYSQRPPGAAWSKADGKLVLTLSADGNTLSGTWYNNNGNSGPKQLIRTKSLGAREN